MSKPILGCDLGTGFSCVSVIEGGKAVVVANQEGSRTTPSVVMIKNGERKVGGTAKRQMVMNPKNTISFVKRFMGSNWNDKDVQTMIRRTTYEVVNENGKPRIKIDGKSYSPEEISSYILSYMKKVAEDYYGQEVKDAVITCPAWYNDTQRQAVKVAGELAGLNVLRVINEPTAAILSANIDASKKDKTILVADCGTGTVDYSLCSLSEVDGQQMIEVLASYGDVFLGGQDYDNAIVDWICEEFKKDHAGFDLKKDQMAYSRLVEAAEKAKCELSSATTTEINLPYITVIDNVPQMLNLTLTRAKFFQLTEELTARIVECGRKCIEKAGKTYKDLDEILLVGGLTRALNIQEALTKEFGCPLDKSANPDEAVALGAGIQANILVGGSGAKDVLLLDVTPISLGIETLGGVMTKLVEANTTIPTTKKETFSTAVDNQPSVEIRVLQGERPMANDNKEIGRFHLDGIAPAKRGIPQIEVEFSIDANGILSVKATDKATGKEQHVTIDNSNSLTQEEIDRIKREADQFKEEDERRKKEIEEMNMISSVTASIKNLANDDSLKDKISADDKGKIDTLANEIDSLISSKKYSEAREKNEELQKIWQPIAAKMYQSQQTANGQAGNPQNPFGDMFGDKNPFGGMNTDKESKEDTNNVQDVEAEEVK